jgi:hypothetical protein
MKADKIIIGKKNDMEMNNIEEGGHKRKKKGYQSTYDFQKSSPTISNMNFTSSFLGNQSNTQTSPPNNQNDNHL